MPYNFDDGDWKGQFAFDREGGLRTIDHAHHEVHDGNYFHVNKTFEMGANDTGQVLFRITGAKVPHISITRTFGANAYYELWEGCTVTGASGTALTAYCMNRSALLSPSVKFFFGPEGISATGTALIGTEFIAGGAGASKVGQVNRPNTEWVLAGSKTYLVRFVALAAQTAHVAFEWYEE